MVNHGTAGKVLAGCLLLMACSASAQTNQTAEGAQKFLALQAEGSSVDVMGVVSITIHRSHNDGTKDSIPFAAYPKAQGLSMGGQAGGLDACTTAVGRLQFSAGELSVLQANYVRYSQDALRRSQFVNWGKASINRHENGIWIANGVPNGSGMVSLVFKTADRDLLDRIEYATKFLQMSCDAAADTGF